LVDPCKQLVLGRQLPLADFQRWKGGAVQQLIGSRLGNAQGGGKLPSVQDAGQFVIGMGGLLQVETPFIEKSDLVESAVNFLYGNFKGIFKFLSGMPQSREKLLGHTENMVHQHPYFGMAAQAAHRLHESSSAPFPDNSLAALLLSLQTAQKDIEVLVSQCLNMELRRENSVPELYTALLGRGVFSVTELTYQKVKTEVMPVHAVPPKKRGLMPEMLTAGELHERGIETAFAEVLCPETVTDLYRYLKSLYLRREVRFKPCKHCGRYFVVTGNGGAEYCNRLISGSSRTRRQIGAVQIYQSCQLENPAVKLFTKSYKTHNARVRYGTLTHEQFAEWSKEARAKRDECVSGKLPLEDLREWLDNH